MKKEDSLIMNGEHLDATRMYLGSDIINHINKIYEDIETETISDVFKELENRSCTNCFFNSSKDKNLELITCDKMGQSSNYSNVKKWCRTNHTLDRGFFKGYSFGYIKS